MHRNKTLVEAFADLEKALKDFRDEILYQVWSHPIIFLLWALVGLLIVMWDLGCQSHTFNFYCG